MKVRHKDGNNFVDILTKRLLIATENDSERCLVKRHVSINLNSKLY